nr:hypothetical protein [uncultured Alistipes sp.]
MKKYSLLMGLMCAALSITSCSKDNTETFDKPKGYEFELYAAPQTRTEVDGLDMKWSANDAMNVFHALPGTTNYSANDQFTVSDIEGGVFKGTITDTEFDPNGTYDWYAVYPYSKYMASPAESNSGSYFVVGSKNINTQQQTSIDNQAHICGENIPLYGKATGVTSPRLEMHHIATLFRINVANTGSADLNVTGITLTSASENLIGSYYFDITGETPVLTPYRDDYVSKTATLNVTDGIVTPGTTGSFYLATRAFTAPEGEQLTLTVTANGETVEKVATLSKETTFAAGKINKLNVNMAAAAEQAATWEKVTSLDDITAGEYIIVNGDYFLPTTTTNSAPAIHSLESQGISFVNDSYTGIVPDIAKWTFTGTNTAMTITNSGGNYLYGEDDSKGIGVGSTSGTTWAFEVYNDGFAMKNTSGRYCAIYVNNDNEPDGWRSYTSRNATNYKINGGILYIYKKGDARPALETPTGVEAVAEGNEVLVGWKPVAGATSYTVSFEPATIEPRTVLHNDATAEYSELFEGLDYATEYTVSVVANPADAENYKASAPATATFTTGENPNPEPGFEPGDYVIMAYAGNKYYALSSTPSDTRLAASEIAYDGTSETVAAADETIVWTIAQSGTDYTIQNNAQYLSWPSGNEANLSDTEYALSITQNEDGTTYTIASVATPERILAKNNTASYFAFYKKTSDQKDELYLVKADRNAVSLTTTDKSVSFAAAGESKDITFRATNLGSNQVFATISGDGAGQYTASVGDGIVTVTAAENTETTAKTATLTLYIAASEGGEHLAEATVALTQAAKPTGDGPAVGTILWQDNFSVVSGTTKLKNLSGSNDGFTEDYSNLTNVYSMTESIRVGTASKAGSITLPVLTNIPEGNVANIQISFKAEGWNKKTAKITLSTNTGNIDGDNTLSITSSSTMAGTTPALSANAPEYTYRVTGVNNLTTLTLDTNYSIGIDDLKIIVID